MRVSCRFHSLSCAHQKLFIHLPDIFGKTKSTQIFCLPRKEIRFHGMPFVWKCSIRFIFPRVPINLCFFQFFFFIILSENINLIWLCVCTQYAQTSIVLVYNALVKPDIAMCRIACPRKTLKSLTLHYRCVAVCVSRASGLYCTVASTMMLNLRPQTHTNQQQRQHRTILEKAQIWKIDLRVCRAVRFACKLTEKRLCVRPYTMPNVLHDDDDRATMTTTYHLQAHCPMRSPGSTHFQRPKGMCKVRSRLSPQTIWLCF